MSVTDPTLKIIGKDPNLSPHLSWDELRCHDAMRTPYPLNWRDDRAPVLARVFEAIRHASGGRPITVISAYRTPAYNATCKGSAPDSQHVQGRALDLAPPYPLTVEEFHQIILVLAKDPAIPLGGVGIYDTFVHVDTRPRPPDHHLAQWDNRTHKGEP